MDGKKCRRIVKKVSRLLLVQIVEVLEEEIAREKKVSVRRWLARRSTHGGSALLLKELYTEDPVEYHACLRMSPECFDTLHDLIASAIPRSDTCWYWWGKASCLKIRTASYPLALPGSLSSNLPCLEIPES
jgi:hypothetical protein